jgi:hypothetical protein
MTGKTVNTYNKMELLEEFKEFAERMEEFLSCSYDGQFSREAVKEISEEYETIIPEIPYIGGDDNPMTPNLLSSARYLSVYNVLKRKGLNLEEIGNISYSVEDEFFRKHREFIPPLCHPKAISMLKYSAQKSGKYPGDFVYTFVEGDDFDLGLDFSECALYKFFKKFNADEFMPYLCAMDIIMSKYGNLGLHRTKTLVDGDDICDFRYKAGRNTHVASKVIK